MKLDLRESGQNDEAAIAVFRWPTRFSAAVGSETAKDGEGRGRVVPSPTRCV